MDANLPTDTRSGSSVKEALRFAEALGRSCAAALEGSIAGVILHGSLTLGDYIPGRSDADLLVVVNDSLADSQLAALTESQRGQRGRVPVPADLRVVTRQVAAVPTRRPPMEAYIRFYPRSEAAVETRHPGERDLVVEFSICRAHGRRLSGATSAELIGEVPTEWVLAVGDAQLADWQRIGDDPQYAELAVLTACRIWRYAQERRHGSKTAAAEWVLSIDPTLDVVRQTLQQRRGHRTGSINGEQVQDLLAMVRARLEAEMR
jgi:aminoglycoside adenylyltransferase-like protein/nucleotidyltransferase-like protein